MSQITKAKIKTKWNEKQSRNGIVIFLIGGIVLKRFLSSASHIFYLDGIWF